MNISILFENKDFFVLNKPAGLMVHSDGRSSEFTLADWLIQEYPELGSVGEPWNSSMPLDQFPRAGVAHRLDRETSGCIIVARNQDAFEHIKDQFQQHAVQKTYHALVYGEVKEVSGIIEAPIGRSASDFRKWSAQRGARGKMREAVTEWKVLQSFETATLVEFKPKTGRTHQIRVHAKYMNHPIVADALYAGKLVERLENLGFDRQALHARAVTFQDSEGGVVQVEAPYPADFQHALEKKS